MVHRSGGRGGVGDRLAAVLFGLSVLRVVAVWLKWSLATSPWYFRLAYYSSFDVRQRHDERETDRF